jgi:phosphatidylserine decarboxylase
MGRIERDSTFLVKGRPYSVEELVGDRAEAERYVGGGGFVVYLSPRDYHRVHSPVSGTIALIRSMPGDYYPVNSIGMRHVPNLFVRNRRVAIAVDTPDLGCVTIVMVAAMVVGRITVTGVDARDVPFGTHTPDLEIERGAEIGQFHLGSTVVVLLESAALDRWLAAEGPVRYGQAVAEGHAPSKRKSNGG